MSFTVDLLSGMADDIVTAGIAVRSITGYAATDTAITFGKMPATPDRVVCLTAYQPGGDSPDQALGQIGVQIRTRGTVDPFDEMALRDQIYQLFQGAQHKVYASIEAIQFLNISSIPLGQDGDGRWEYATNFYVDVQVPSTANRA